MAGTWSDERLSDLSDRTDAGFERVERNLIDIRNEIRVQIGAVRAEAEGRDRAWRGEIGSFRTEVGAGIDSFRTEVGGEIDSLRTEVRGEIGSLRGELRSDIGALRLELDSLRGLIIRLNLGMMLAILVAVVTRSL